MATYTNEQYGRMAEMAELANASYNGGRVPAGWTTIRPADLIGLEQHDGGAFYISGTAAARVLLSTQTGEIAVSIRGTDSLYDLAAYPSTLFCGMGYDDYFLPLVAAIRETFGTSTSVTYVGHSLGGAAVHELAGRYGESDRYFSFESPLICNDQFVTSFGFSNDWVYDGDDRSYPGDARRVFIANDFSSFGSALSEKDGTHGIGYAINALYRLENSALSSILDLARDTIVFNCSPVLDLSAGEILGGGTLTRKVYIFGMDQSFRVKGDGFDYRFTQINDEIRGTNHGAYSDWIDGMAGHDTILGLDGNDRLFGGSGRDSITGGEGFDSLFGGSGSDVLADLNDGETDVLYGGVGNDHLTAYDRRGGFLFGGAGSDTLLGGDGEDTYLWVPNDLDTIIDDSDNHVYFSCQSLNLESIGLVDYRVDFSKVQPTSLSTRIFTLDDTVTAYGDAFTFVDLGNRAKININFTNRIDYVTLYVGNSGSAVTISDVGEGTSSSVFGGSASDSAIVGQGFVDKQIARYLASSEIDPFFVPVIYFHEFEHVTVDSSLSVYFDEPPERPDFSGTFFINESQKLIQYRDVYGNNENICRFRSYDCDIDFI